MVSIVSELGIEVIFVVICLEVVEMVDKLVKLGADQSTTSVGVILRELTLLFVRMIGLKDVFVIGIFPGVISTT